MSVMSVPSHNLNYVEYEFERDNMKKMWFTAKELAGLEGLPTSPQGINLMARREGWKNRRKRGIQGKAVEYCRDSLPGEIQSQLTLCEPSAPYQTQRVNTSQIWNEAYHQLTENECNKIVKYILRYGLSSLLARIEEEGEELTPPPQEHMPTQE